MSESTDDDNDPQVVAGRRPLNSRNWRIFQIAAGRIAQTTVTPNMISVSSVMFAAIAGICLVATSYCQSGGALAAMYLLAAGGMQLRLVANLLDGMVAVEGGKRSPVGVLYNEVPDRISDSLILVGAGYSLVSRPELGLMAAVVAVFVAYVRAIGSSAGTGEVFAGPMAKPQRMALLTGGCIVCALVSWMQWGDGGSWQSHVMGTVLGLIIVGGMITAAVRLRIIAAKLRAGSDLISVGASDDFDSATMVVEES